MFSLDNKKGFTLLEILLVIVVISTIIFVAIGQFHRYQQARSLQIMKNTVQELVHNAFVLFNADCASMYSNLWQTDPKTAQPFQVICPQSAASSSTITSGQLLSSDESNCDQVKMSDTSMKYTIWIKAGSKNRLPIITVALPVPAPILGNATAGNPQQSQTLVKYITALAPTRIAFSSAETYYPATNSTVSSSDDICTTSTGAAACFEWDINPLNGGSLKTSWVSNANGATNLLQSYGLYYTANFLMSTPNCADAMNYLLFQPKD